MKMLQITLRYKFVFTFYTSEARNQRFFDRFFKWTINFKIWLSKNISPRFPNQCLENWPIWSEWRWYWNWTWLLEILCEIADLVKLTKENYWLLYNLNVFSWSSKRKLSLHIHLAHFNTINVEDRVNDYPFEKIHHKKCVINEKLMCPIDCNISETCSSHRRLNHNGINKQKRIYSIHVQRTNILLWKTWTVKKSKFYLIHR